MRVAIAGGGNVGSYIAKDLHAAGHDVTVLEENPEIAARLKLTLPVTVIHADACEASRLHDADLATCDVVVAATGEDQVNLVVALLAKQEFAVPKVVARVNHPDNHWLFNESWGVDQAVSTPHLLTALVEEAVTVGSLVKLLQVGREGDAGLVEVTLAPESPAANKTIVELFGAVREATIVAVVRSGHVVVPRGDTVLMPGDEVMVLVTGDAESIIKQVLIGS